MRWSLICTILLIFYTQNIKAAKILVLATVSSHSHAIFTSAITSALAARGHELVVLSPDKEKRAIRNITTIYLEGGYDDKLFNIILEDMPSSEGLLDYFRMYTEFSTATCQTLLFSPGNKKFHRDHRDHKFDLILFDIGCSECFLKYAHVFGHPPIVAYSAFFTIQPYNLGNFYNPAYVPHFATGFGDRMKFNERLTNWLYYQYNSFWRRYLYLPAVDQISDAFFGFSEPKIADLEREISLMLTDDHFSISLPRPNVPAVVDVAGLHIKPAKALPDELKEFVEGAKHGVIFFSLGSNFLSKHMSQQRKQLFLEAFSQLPQRVVWKYEDETLQNLPKNVLVKKWCPQTDILGHNNTVLFMTHNGYLSTQESIYFGVPMLGIPVIVDQFQNNAKMVKAGIALRLDLKEINSAEQIRNKIMTILNNPSFRKKAQEMSVLFRDRPMTPLDTAIYWIEYVLRHKGAKQLRVASLDLAWYQYYLLDIYFLIAVSVFALYYVLVAFFRAILSDEPKEKEA